MGVSGGQWALVGAVVVCCALFFWRLGRRREGGWPVALAMRRPVQALRLDGTLRLSPSHAVHVVCHQERRWLIGCHGGGITLLGEFHAEVLTSPGQRERAS
jgi:hypothetical protein